jgi:hypothetical protein
MLPQRGPKSTKDKSKLRLELILCVFFASLWLFIYIRGLGLGVGVGLGAGSVGDGAGLGLALGLGFGSGSGLASGLGLTVGLGEGCWLGIVLGFVDGFETSVPVAVGVVPLPAAILFDVVNIHCDVAPVTGLRVSLLPLFLPRNDITGEPAPDICRATAVYPLVFDAMIRPLLPSAVVNWFPVIVRVCSPLRPPASQLTNVPV